MTSVLQTGQQYLQVFHALIISKTSSATIGSKYNLSDTSKSVETVSGFEFIMIVSTPSSLKAELPEHNNNQTQFLDQSY